MITLLCRTQLIICIICLIPISIFSQSKWQISIGNSLTQYDFVSSKGIPLEFIKRGSGTVYQVGYSNQLIDTLQFTGQSTSKALYFLKHPKLAKILTAFTYEGNLLLNQMNAVGDIQNIAFDYQTNFVGFQASMGPRFQLSRGWNLTLMGNLSIQKLIQGNQHFNFAYVDLRQDESFNALQFFTGYGMKLQKQINQQIGFFVNYQKNATHKSFVAEKSNLNFTNEQLLIGIQIKTQK